MYSPTERVLTVLEMLEARGSVSGPELARRLEVDVRTVRRYIVALQDLGIPVESERGPNGSYRLGRGHRMPPLVLTEEEATAIALGVIATRKMLLPVDPAAVESAVTKIERLLPKPTLDRVRGLRDTVQFTASPPDESAPRLSAPRNLAVIGTATREHRCARIVYRSRAGTETTRDVEPYGLVYDAGYWYFAGWCRLRHDVRTFRVDRTLNIELLEERFDGSQDIDVIAHVARSVSHPNPDRHESVIEVLLDTTVEHARTVISPFLGEIVETSSGVTLRRYASQLEWVAWELLLLDFPFTVVRPQTLRDELRKIADKANSAVEVIR